ncbi:MAG: 23S rRNA (pseudouridine(1915)-N(3))-methyltransferase RlmH [Burkholderiales bacterium]|nr:23S rRNA (pseudouridine(1915)-N(3))-methyltransferase RlmH [Burkholderiales bacterium]
MRVTILAVGHKMPAWIEEGFREYTRRMPPEVRVELIEVKPGRDRQAEGEKLLDALPSGATLLALDERGKAFSTQGLSVMLSEWMRDASHPAFAIGGADGLSDAVRGRAAKLLSLSTLTLPHQLARVVLAEQLYRAWSILARHPYHRE